MKRFAVLLDTGGCLALVESVDDGILAIKRDIKSDSEIRTYYIARVERAINVLVDIRNNEFIEGAS